MPYSRRSLKIRLLYLSDRVIASLLKLFFRLKQIPPRKLFMGFLVALLVLLCLGIFKRAFLTARTSALLNQQATARQVIQFMDRCLEEINTIYRTGHNETIHGIKETRSWMNTYKDVTSVQLSVALYIARGYFERMLEDLNHLGTFNGLSLEIKDLLFKAAKTRGEAINLYTSGFLLKEQIGKTMLSNFLADKNKMRLLPVPEYHGEIEQGLGKIPVANQYLIEALSKMKKLVESVSLGRFYDSSLASLIGDYSEVSLRDLDSYYREGKMALEKKDFYHAIIAYHKILKLKGDDKEIWVSLVQAYGAIGDNDKAMETTTKARQLFPNDANLDVLKSQPVADQK